MGGRTWVLWEWLKFWLHGHGDEVGLENGLILAWEKSSYQMRMLTLFRQQGDIECFKPWLALYIAIVIWLAIRYMNWRLIGADSKRPIHQIWVPVVLEAMKVRINTMAVDFRVISGIFKNELKRPFGMGGR